MTITTASATCPAASAREELAPRGDIARATVATQRRLHIETRGAKCGEHAERQPTHDRERERECEHVSVHRDLLRARCPGRKHCDQHSHCRHREREPGCCSEPRHDEALGEELRNDPRAPGAECGADRDLTLARGCSLDVERRDVHAREQEHEPDGGEQEQERRACAADDRLTKRHDVHVRAPLIRHAHGKGGACPHEHASATRAARLRRRCSGCESRDRCSGVPHQYKAATRARTSPASRAARPRSENESPAGITPTIVRETPSTEIVVPTTRASAPY